MQTIDTTRTFLLAATLSFFAAGSYAQTGEVDTSTMTPRELYQYAEALRTGDSVEVDLEAALALHGQLAQNGQTRSYERMARILLELDRPEEAKLALESGSLAGDQQSQRNLAVWHIQGRFGEFSEPSLGVTQLQAFLQNSDDQIARYVLARAYEEGTGTAVQQEEAFEIYSGLAAENHLASLHKLADFTRDGTFGSPNLAAAADLYTRAGEGGYTASWASLARLYLDLGLPDEALIAYDRAMEAGFARASIEFARGHFAGSFGDLSDPEAGFRALEAVAAETSNPNTQFMLAMAHENGQGTAQDLGKAVAIYEALARENHGRSLHKLGDFARDGLLGAPDPTAAADFYSRAGEAGSSYSWLALAELLIDEGDEAGAIEAYERAIDTGFGRATTQYARNHFLGNFGELSDRALGAEILEEDAEGGDVYAAATALQLWERRSRRINTLDLEGVIAFLDEEMRAGDSVATVSLARAYRVLQWRLPNARQRHRELVTNFGDQLGRSYFREYLHSVYDRNQHRQSRERAYEIIQPLGSDDFRLATAALRSTEPTAFVYLLQKELADLGYYSGSASGRFDRRTLQATLAFCEVSNIADECVHGPLTHAASMAIISALGDARG